MFKSIITSEELGSPSNSDNFVAPGSNFDWVNFLIFNVESDLSVETVPLESKTTFALAPVLTV